ncbi:cellulose synthase subunit BcsC [compost metagenome]
MRRATSLLMALGLALMTTPAFAADTSKAELDLLRQRVTASPQDPSTHFDMAMGLARTSRLEEGWTSLKKVSELDPAYADKVIATYAPMVDENPQNIEAQFRLAFGHYFKGLNFQDQGQADAAKEAKLRAKKAFGHIIETDPQYVWGYNYLAYLLAEEGDLSAAVDTLKKAIAVEPNNAVSHFLIGQAYFRQGNHKDAVLEIGTAMRLRGMAP